jgi:hypothetical protein
VSGAARAMKFLVGLGALAVFPACYFIQPYLSDRVSVCFFRTFTGYRCPFCGLSHAMAAAMHGRFRTASHYHPLWGVAVMLLISIGFAGFSDALRGTDHLRVFRVMKSKASWPWIALVLAIFWIVNARWGRP